MVKTDVVWRGNAHLPSARQWTNSPWGILCLQLSHSILTLSEVQCRFLANNIHLLLVDFYIIYVGFYIVYLESFCPSGLIGLTWELVPKCTSYCSYFLLWLWTTVRSWPGTEGGFPVLQDNSLHSGKEFSPIDIPTLWVSLTLLLPLVITRYPCWLSHH